MRHQSSQAFILHTRKYSDTSLIVDLLLENGERLALLSKGALRPKSRLQGVLRPFNLLSIQFIAKRSLGNLTDADSLLTLQFAESHALYCALYINELISLLVKEHDPHDGLFAIYQNALNQLATLSQMECNGDSAGIAGTDLMDVKAGEATSAKAKTLRRIKYGWTLRYFEFALLELLGYGVDFSIESTTGEPIVPELSYRFHLEHGLNAVTSELRGGFEISGKALLALVTGEGADSLELFNEVKRLVRYLLDYYLDGRQIRSRELFRK